MSIDHFKEELADLLHKHNVAIIAERGESDNPLAVQIGFMRGMYEKEWTNRHHITSYDLDGDQRQ